MMTTAKTMIIDDDDNDNDCDDEKNKVLRLIPMQTSEMGVKIFSNTSVCAQPPTTGPQEILKPLKERGRSIY